jgi:glycosyltransferase involved in cell wall biosynthesis
MRIAWVLYGSLEQRTGGTIYDAEVVRGLARAGDDVQVVSLDDGAAGDELATRLLALAADVVVGDELCFRALGPAYRRLARERSAALRVLLVHHLTAWETELSAEVRRAALADEKAAIDASERVVTTSQTTRERLLAECAPQVDVDVVLPGADRLALTVPAAHAEAIHFAFLGSVVPRKRVLELVRAFESADARSRLTLLGSTTRDAAYVAEVRATIARLDLGHRVAFGGEVDEDGVSRALADADVLVMPSSLEGYGIAATEAIHAGVPVIAARAQGLEEALAPCPDAAMFADDEPALALALARFASDTSLRARMIAAARAAAPRMPTWASCAAQFRAALARPRR